MHDPIAYTYEADHHCPGCTEARFGRSEDGWIAGENEDGSYPVDGEGNPVGVVAPWDEWWEPSLDEPQTLVCGTCGGEIDEIVPDGWIAPFDEPEARDCAAEWHGGQASALYALSSTGTILADAASEVRECLDEVEYDDDRRHLERLAEWIEIHYHPASEQLL